VTRTTRKTSEKVTIDTRTNRRTRVATAAKSRDATTTATDG